MDRHHEKRFNYGDEWTNSIQTEKQREISALREALLKAQEERDHFRRLANDYRSKFLKAAVRNERAKDESRTSF